MYLKKTAKHKCRMQNNGEKTLQQKMLQTNVQCKIMLNANVKCFKNATIKNVQCKMQMQKPCKIKIYNAKY